MDKANHDEFTPVYALGFFRKNPAARSYEYLEGVTSIQIAGMMTAFLDSVIDSLDDQHQLQFEEEVLECFEEFMERRHENSSKYKLSED